VPGKSINVMENDQLAKIELNGAKIISPLGQSEFKIFGPIPPCFKQE